MPAIRYTFSAADVFSDELRAALRRRVHEIVGGWLDAQAARGKALSEAACWFA